VLIADLPSGEDTAISFLAGKEAQRLVMEDTKLNIAFTGEVVYHKNFHKLIACDPLSAERMQRLIFW
jgi:hypothetical protein